MMPTILAQEFWACLVQDVIWAAINQVYEKHSYYEVLGIKKDQEWS